jgi:hypothetical protein
MGGKQELTDRILTFLQTGTIRKKTIQKTYHAKWDWNTENLSLETIITDNYKNSENVRAFLTKEIGTHFRFTVEFMEWIKRNSGKTLQDAVIEWKRIYVQKKDSDYKMEIAVQFEYNTYIRDFMADNKDKTLKDAIKCWKWKRNQRGDNKYTKDDLTDDSGQ